MNDASLQRVIAAYGLPAGTRIHASLGDRVTRLQAPSGDVVVKHFAPEDARQASLEATLLAHLGGLAQPRYRIQTLLRTSNGEPMLIGDGVEIVTRFEEGRHKVYTEITDEEWSILGRSLAALHERLDEGSLPALDRLSVIVARRDLGAERAKLLAQRERTRARDGERTELIARYFDDQLLLLDERGARCREHIPEADSERAIHNDYNQFNYLFSDGALPVILDWERALAAPREYEVVRCLNHLPLVAAGMARSFLRGYLSVRALRPSALAWSVDAALTDHALRLWRVDAWLRGEPDARSSLTNAAAMLRVLCAGREQLDDFFADPAWG